MILANKLFVEELLEKPLDKETKEEIALRVKSMQKVLKAINSYAEDVYLPLVQQARENGVEIKPTDFADRIKAERESKPTEIQR